MRRDLVVADSTWADASARPVWARGQTAVLNLGSARVICFADVWNNRQIV